MPGPSVGEVAVLLRPVAALRLEEDHRVRVVDRAPQQPVRVERRRGHDHLQPRGVGVVGLGALAVVLLAPDAAERRDPDDDRHADPASGPLPVLREVADHLVERRVGEPVELHLGDRAPAGHRQPDADRPRSRPRRSACRTRARSPNSAWRPSVTRKTPPSAPTSSPNTSVRGSSARASRRAAFSAATIVTSAIAEELLALARAGSAADRRTRGRTSRSPAARRAP